MCVWGGGGVGGFGWLGFCPGVCVWRVGGLEFALVCGGVSYGMIISQIPYVAPPLFQRVVFLWEDRQA